MRLFTKLKRCISIMFSVLSAYEIVKCWSCFPTPQLYCWKSVKKHVVIELSWKIGSTFFGQTAEVFTLKSQSKNWNCKASCRKKRFPGTFPTSESLGAEMARKMKKFILLEKQTFCCSKPLSTFVHQSINQRFFFIGIYELPNIAISSLQQQLVESK